VFFFFLEMQKPDDIEGECPFSNGKEPCPYGLACRFLGTHKKDGVFAGNLDAKKISDEKNGLNKNVQKLLWKNKMRFPKADAKLKSLGLMVPTLKFCFSFLFSIIFFFYCSVGFLLI
jgi:tRNA-dihydrouridine synthase 3